MAALIDISPPLSEAIAVWPGDLPYRREVMQDMARGDASTLSAIHATLHLGAHVDGPCHHRRGAPGIAEVPLDVYYGPCQVIAVDVPRGARIRPADLPGPLTEPRVLFKTGTFPDPTAWSEDFASLSRELIDQAARAGIVLLGLDTPSVDPFADGSFESHHALADHGMANLEGVVLDHVAPGRYLLIALPLALNGADASPVRAALAPLPG